MTNKKVTRSNKVSHNEDPTLESPIEEVTKTIASVNCDFLNVRSNPGIENPIIFMLSLFDEVEIIDDYEGDPEWVKVKTEYDVEGYCMFKYLSIGV